VGHKRGPPKYGLAAIAVQGDGSASYLTA